jgi:hypothetical protein
VARAYAPAAPAQRTFAETTTASGLTVRASGDSVDLRPRAAGVNRLVAAKVNVPPSFTPQPASPSNGLPLYRHPADKNAAATGVRLGASLDLNG